MANPIAGQATQYKPGQNDPEVAQRWAAAVRLRMAGASYQQIADQLGYADPSGAYYAVQDALKATVAEPAEEYRTLELERLDRIQMALWQTAVKIRKAKDEDGNPAEPTKRQLEVIDRLLNVMGTRAKLLGLNAPEKHDHTTKGRAMIPTGFDTLPDDDLDQLDAIARRLVAVGPNGRAGGD